MDDEYEYENGNDDAYQRAIAIQNGNLKHLENDRQKAKGAAALIRKTWPNKVNQTKKSKQNA